LITKQGSFYLAEALLRFKGEVASGGTPIRSPLAGPNANVTSAMIQHVQTLPNGLLNWPNYGILPWPFEDLDGSEWFNLWTLWRLRASLGTDGYKQPNLLRSDLLPNGYPHIPLGFWTAGKFFVENFFRVDQLSPQWQLDWSLYLLRRNADPTRNIKHNFNELAELARARQLAKEHSLPLPPDYQVAEQVGFL
jgi:hypothetical protein